MEIINVADQIIEVNVTNDIVNIIAQTGAYPLPNNVYSVFGRVGNVVAASGDYNTDLVGEGLINQYYTNARSRAAISENITGMEYSSASGIFSLTSGYVIPTQAMLDAKVPYTGATGNVNLGEHQISAGQVTFDQTPTGAAGVGVMRWNDTDGTLDVGLKGGNVTLQVGQEIVARVVNKTGADLLESQYRVVKISSAQGQRLAVNLAQANNDNNSADTLGIVTETIANNQEGFITILGQVKGINTTGSLQGETWVDGDVLYLSPTTAGAITNIKPAAPYHMVVVGYVEYAHQNNGKIYAKVQNGYELEELHDVAPLPYINKGVLYRDTATNLWKSATIDTLLGYTPVTSARTISTTAPLNGGGDLSDNRTLSITQSSTITNGYLSSTDFNTFNNKQSALTFGNLSSGDMDVSGGTAAVIGSGTSLTLKNVNPNVGTYGSSTAIPVISVNAKGLVTGVTTDAVFIPSGALSFIGDVTGTGNTGSDTTLTLKNVNTNVGSYGDSTNVPTIQVNAKGLVTAASQTAIPTAASGTTGLLTSTDYNTFKAKQDALNGTGFVKSTAGVISYDTNTYLTTISGIAAGGELSGTYPNPSLVNSAVTGKVLTGLNLSGGGTIADTDTILGAFGKVQNQISALVGGVMYQGTWNASTNSPSITSSVGTKGYYYIVSVAGSTNINGITDWKVGDWIIFNGSTWDKVDNTDAVSSVNGYTGAVSLVTSDIAESGNLYFTNARAIGSTLTGYTSGAGTISSSDSILTAIQKLNGNIGSLVTGVSSVFSRTGAVTAQSGDYNTDQVTEGSTNLYYTATRFNTAFSGKSTTDLAEGTNLYYTQSRFDTAFGNKTTTNLTEGTNLYYTSARFDTAFSGKTTTNLTEGTNLYYTEARVSANTDVAANTAARHAAVTIGTANGLSLSTQQLSLGLASSSTTGALSSTDWSTFNAKQSALTFGNLTETTSSVLTITGGSNAVIGSGTTIQVKQASGSQSGFLSSTDWTTFNNKVSSATLAGYLPLTGGTLTGALNGTSAVFSSTIDGTIFNSTSNAYRFSGNNALSLVTLNSQNVVKINAGGYWGTQLVGANDSGILINNVGSVGIGITPPSTTNFNHLFVGRNISMFSGSSTDIYIGSNFYYDGGFKVRYSEASAMINTNAGDIIFQNSSSGTAGGTFSGIERLRITSSGNIGIATSNPLSKLSVGGDGYASRAITAIASGTDFGMTLQQNSTGGGLQIYSNNSSWGNIPLQIQNNTGYQFIVNTAGLVGIGTGSPNDKLVVQGASNIWAAKFISNNGQSDAFGVQIFAGTTASDTSFRILNAATTSEYFKIRGDGYLFSVPSYNNQWPGYSANMYVASDGSFGRVTSSLKYKKDVRDYDKGLNYLSKIRPVYYKAKDETKGSDDYVGFIAEEIYQAGLPEFVDYASDGTPDALHYSHMVALLTKAIQELSAKLTALENKA